MICCGSASALSGVVLTCGPRQDRDSQPDHTVIDAGHHVVLAQDDERRLG
jgi:hypothetical protein